MVFVRKITGNLTLSVCFFSEAATLFTFAVSLKHRFLHPGDMVGAGVLFKIESSIGLSPKFHFMVEASDLKEK